MRVEIGKLPWHFGIEYSGDAGGWSICFGLGYRQLFISSANETESGFPPRTGITLYKLDYSEWIFTVRYKAPSEWHSDWHNLWFWHRLWQLGNYDGYFNLNDILLGENIFTEMRIGPEMFANIQVDPGDPITKVKYWPVEFRHVRSRCPNIIATYKKQLITVISDPPMFPGKGENPWDCDDDCIYSTSSEYIDDPVYAYVKAVRTHRARRAGKVYTDMKYPNYMREE